MDGFFLTFIGGIKPCRKFTDPMATPLHCAGQYSIVKYKSKQMCKKQKRCQFHQLKAFPLDQRVCGFPYL